MRRNGKKDPDFDCFKDFFSFLDYGSTTDSFFPGLKPGPGNASTTVVSPLPGTF